MLATTPSSMLCAKKCQALPRRHHSSSPLRSEHHSRQKFGRRSEISSGQFHGLQRSRALLGCPQLIVQGLAFSV